ncbi:MAG TPA: hypothetical protein VGY77_11930 [Gemmataceae bacterium]|jgi:hypothetical protein|nr:hypothetical protein [Gemmataceae bacterium]
MTTLGKILVIVNFLFSVVTGALIVMVFVTRTNWKAGFDEINTQNAILKAERNSYVQAIEGIKNSHQGEINKLKNELAQANNAAAKATQDAKDANSQKELMAKNFESEKANHAKDLEELKRRQAEVENITKAAAAKDDKINALEKDNGDFRNRAVAAEINFKAEHERNARLLDQLEKLAKDNERLQQQAKGGGIIAGAPPKKAPPDDVKGTVVEIDAKSGLLTISIGSDSGINVGHTLEVYRLEPNPEYLGSIKIVDVHFKQAVARAVLPLKTEKLRKGDVVASRIVALR